MICKKSGGVGWDLEPKRKGRGQGAAGRNGNLSGVEVYAIEGELSSVIEKLNIGALRRHTEQGYVRLGDHFEHFVGLDGRWSKRDAKQITRHKVLLRVVVADVRLRIEGSQDHVRQERRWQSTGAYVS